MSLPSIELDLERETPVGLETEEMTLNMGPQHPSTHGVLRFVVKADGEVMRRAIPDIGYLHRSIEKISEKVGYHGFMPYTDRVDYVSAMQCNQGWAMACESLEAPLVQIPRKLEISVAEWPFEEIRAAPSACGLKALRTSNPPPGGWVTRHNTPRRAAEILGFCVPWFVF